MKTLLLTLVASVLFSASAYALTTCSYVGPVANLAYCKAIITQAVCSADPKCQWCDTYRSYPPPFQGSNICGPKK